MVESREAAERQRPGSGHRTVPHTADLCLEAWSPSAEGCIGEAVRALVEGFADTSGAEAVGDREYAVTARTEEDLLVSVLEEVIYRMDADGEVPLAAQVGGIRPIGDGRSLSVSFLMADIGAARLVGAVPKAVSLHGLHLRGGPGGWRCRVTVDV
jgi:SHS2 domain-containing protein